MIFNNLVDLVISASTMIKNTSKYRILIWFFYELFAFKKYSIIQMDNLDSYLAYILIFFVFKNKSPNCFLLCIPKILRINCFFRVVWKINIIQNYSYFCFYYLSRLMSKVNMLIC